MRGCRSAANAHRNSNRCAYSHCAAVHARRLSW